MTTLSGLATASGASVAMAAPRDGHSELRAGRDVAVLKAQARTARAVHMPPPRPVVAPGQGGGATGTATAGSDDVRYQRFMKALEALRNVTDDPRADEAKLAELAAENPQISGLFDGRPTPVEPEGGTDDG